MIFESKFGDQNDMPCDKFLLDQLTFNGRINDYDERTKIVWLYKVEN